VNFHKVTDDVLKKIEADSLISPPVICGGCGGLTPALDVRNGPPVICDDCGNSAPVLEVRNWFVSESKVVCNRCHYEH